MFFVLKISCSGYLSSIQKDFLPLLVGKKVEVDENDPSTRLMNTDAESLMLKAFEDSSFTKANLCASSMTDFPTVPFLCEPGFSLRVNTTANYMEANRQVGIAKPNLTCGIRVKRCGAILEQVRLLVVQQNFKFTI